jgi:hypothetical protein
VPPYATVVGVPGHVIAYHDTGNDAVVRLPDPEWDRIEELEGRVRRLEALLEERQGVPASALEPGFRTLD